MYAVQWKEVECLRVNDLFSLIEPQECELFDGLKLPWDTLRRIPDFIAKLVGNRQTIKGEVMDGATLSDSPVFVGEGARIEPGAYVVGPAYIGSGSILGHRVNLGAGTKLSNLPITSGSGRRPSIKLENQADAIDTGLAKLGAILGDDVETGCNVVLSPGVVIGQRSLVYPGVCLAKGLCASDTIIKLRQECPTAVRVEPASPGTAS